MDIHPWTKYEIARLRDEERLLRARAAMRAVELREARAEAEVEESAASVITRLRRLASAGRRAPAESGA